MKVKCNCPLMAYSPISPYNKRCSLKSLTAQVSQCDADTAVMARQSLEGLQSYLALQSTMLPRVSYCTSLSVRR
ncbi:hypothetical protein J6590_078561 [Homalodisca vitripennis]|nr:hypothetical protein J6590_078561 [Homalodisca vitripennis]